VLPDSRIDFVHIMMCVLHGVGLHSLGETCFACVGMCENWHDLIGLRANLGTLGKHMHLEHFTCVCSYVGVIWPDTWFMRALTSCLCYRCHCISYVLHCMARKNGYKRWVRPTV